jgi:predicted MFS family arabinose efflux permease
VRPPLDSPQRRWRNSLFGIFGLTGFGLASWASRIPDMRAVLHADNAQLGVLLVGLSGGSILGLILSSHLVARMGATATIRIAYGISSIALVALGVDAAVAPSPLVVFMLLAAFGAGYSVTDVAMNISATAADRSMKRTLLPVYHAAFCMGAAVGAGVGAVALFVGVPLWGQFAFAGTVALSATLVLTRALRAADDAGSPARVAPPAAAEARQGGTTSAGVGGSRSGQAGSERDDTWRARLAVWRDPRVLLLGAVVLGMTFAEGSANDWLTVAVVQGRHLSTATGALLLGVFLVSMTLARFFGGALVDWLGRVAALRLCAASGVVGLALLIFVPLLPATVIGIVLWGGGAALGFPLGMSAAADDPENANARVAAVATMGYFAFLIGPPVIGFIAEGVGILNALIVVLVAVGVAGLASGAARRR